MANQNEQNVLGLNLNVSQEFIAQAIRNAVNLSIASALDDKDKVLQEIVASALSTKVNEKGIVSNYSSENKFNFIEFFVRKALLDETKEVLKEIVTERKEEIHRMIKKQIQTTKFTNKFCELFCDGITGAIGNEYRTRVELSFEKRTDY